MSLNIAVLMKQTFDTEEAIEIENGRIREDGVKFIINPYDEYAVEEAVRVKERFGGEVTVVSVGPDRTEEAIRTAMAMGADRAVLVDPGEKELDEFGVANVLAAVLRERRFDLIFGGYMAIDDGSAQVGPRVAEELGIPHVSAAIGFRLEGDRAVVERDVEGNLEILELPLPVLVTAQQGLNEPRFPSLQAAMRAKRKPIERLSLDDLDLPAERAAAKTKAIDRFLPPKKKKVRMLEGTAEQAAKELALLLYKEVKF